MNERRWSTWLPLALGLLAVFLVGALIGGAMVAVPGGWPWTVLVAAPLMALMMLGAVLFWLLLLGGLVLLVVWLVQQVTQRAAPEVRPRSALELLEQRYARGEIDREEYLARRQDLTQAA